MSTFINLAMPHPKSVMFSDFPEILQGQGLENYQNLHLRLLYLLLHFFQTPSFETAVVNT